MNECFDCLRFKFCEMKIKDNNIIGCDKYFSDTKEKLKEVEIEILKWKEFRSKNKPEFLRKELIE